MSKWDAIFDKVKAAGAAGVIVSAGMWFVANMTNWLKLKGVPEDVVFAIGTFLGGLVATGAAYLKREGSGYNRSNQQGQSPLNLLVWVLVILILVFVLLKVAG